MMINEIYEYTVTKKAEGKYLLLRMGMILLYVLFTAAFFALCYITRLIPVFALCPILLWIVIFFTWRYVSMEYKYTVEAGMLKLYTVFGSKSKKELAALHIKEAVGFIPLDGSKETLERFAPKETYDLLSSEKAPKDAYAFMIIKNGVRTLALIEAPETSKKAILYYATEAVRAGKITE